MTVNLFSILLCLWELSFFCCFFIKLFKMFPPQLLPSPTTHLPKTSECAFVALNLCQNGKYLLIPRAGPNYDRPRVAFSQVCVTVTRLGALSADPGSQAAVLSWGQENCQSHQRPLLPPVCMPLGSEQVAPPCRSHLHHTSVIVLANRKVNSNIGVTSGEACFIIRYV